MISEELRMHGSEEMREREREKEEEPQCRSSGNARGGAKN
jgi:hypothetical protein